MRLTKQWMTLAAVFIAASAGVGAYSVYLGNELSAYMAEQETAETVWMNDCAAMNRPIDDCLRAWNGRSLRNHYIKKLKDQP